VACGTAYVDEKDANGWDRLVPYEASTEPSEPPRTEELTEGGHDHSDKGKSVVMDDPKPTREPGRKSTNGRSSQSARNSVSSIRDIRSVVYPQRIDTHQCTSGCPGESLVIAVGREVT
jgi:hypothetical protein